MLPLVFLVTAAAAQEPPPLVQLRPPPVPTCTVEAHTVVSPKSARLAAELTETLSPDRLVRETVTTDLNLGLERHPDELAKGELKYPGITDLARSRLTHRILEFYSARKPALNAEIASVYEKWLGEPELVETLKFFRTSAGEKLVRGMTISTAGFESVGNDPVISPEEYALLSRAGAGEAIRSFTGYERIGAATFFRSKAGRGFSCASDETGRIMLRETNAGIDEIMPMVGPIVREAAAEIASRRNGTKK